MREDQGGQKDTRDNLDAPERGIGVVQHRDMRIDVTALLVGSREATQSAQSMQNHAEHDKADKEHVKPELFMTENRCPTGNLNQIPERIFADLHRACKRHVAEQE